MYSQEREIYYVNFVIISLVAITIATYEAVKCHSARNDQYMYYILMYVCVAVLCRKPTLFHY